jgi:hypothetical protein
MLPIVLERHFRPWAYGVGHSRLVLLSRATGDDPDDIRVHFHGVRAVHLRSSYHHLVLDAVDEQWRAEMIAFVDVPPRHRDRLLYLSVSSGLHPGYVVCATANIVAVPRESRPTALWTEPPPESRDLYQLRPDARA